MNKTRIILVGGFLGAGKTTLLWEAASQLMYNGKRVGLVTNDQAPELVDTAILARNDLKVAEVSGSCFCCNFNGLLDALKQVRKEAEADVIIAEPVGSCTDLSATVIQPLKDHLSGELLISPLSVLADPGKLSSIMDGGTAGLHPGAAYIFRKQLEESDLILIGKSDLVNPDELQRLTERVRIHYPGSEVRTISAKTGEGVTDWLNDMMQRTDAGKRLAVVDYDIYAEGEAVLGWLNCTIELSGKTTDWDAFSRTLLQTLSRRFDHHGEAVGHVKLMLENGDQYTIGNLTGKEETLGFRHQAGSSEKARLTLNARVQMTPEKLEEKVSEALNRLTDGPLEQNIIAWRCISPDRPNPTFRYDFVIPGK